MSHFFDCCYDCTSINLTNFDFSQTTNIAYLLCGYGSNTPLSSTLSINLSNVNVSSVENMNYAFSRSSLDSINLSGWNTKNVQSMKGVFY